MLRLERIYQEPSSQFSMDPMDPTMHDPFSSVNEDPYNFPPYTFPQTVHSIIDGYFPYASCSHPPSVSPSISTTQSSEQPSLRSSMSCASPASPSPSTIGSPYSREIVPSIGSVEEFPHHYEMDQDSFTQQKFRNSFVDPSLIQQQNTYSHPAIQYADEPPFQFDQSPYSAITSTQHQEPQPSHPSPYDNAFSPRQPLKRRDSVRSNSSVRSRHTSLPQSPHGDDEGKEKGRCPHPDCRRVFKDLKAHMLTHLSERPEKCPIATCEYHLKGFARKYDKNRHTLTHYKGTMVCGFCPGSGSAAEKSFNRADVFKRHLTSVHGVEQTAPNCRKKSPPASSNRKPSNYSNDGSGKCSTCSATFSDAQEFYEHLDDCVLRVVQQEEPSEAINQQRLNEVASDSAVRETMERNRLVDTAVGNNPVDNESDDGQGDGPSSNTNGRSGKGSIKGNAAAKPASATLTGVSKSRSTTSRKRNKTNYPAEWGCPANKMKMKKRVLCLYDGERPLWKDEMMLDNEFEVRVKLHNFNDDGREPYVTDLDVATLKRSEGVLNATEDERGPWAPGTGIQGLIGPAAVPIVGVHQDLADEVNLDELMS